MRPNAQLTAVVITHNRVAEALHTVGRMRALDEIARVIVIDNASEDGTCECLRARYPDVLTVPLRENLGAAARNIGVQLARTPYVVLCDDDTWWEPRCLSRALDTLDRYPRAAMLTARVVIEPDGRIDPSCLAMARSPLGRVGATAVALLGFLAGAVVVRRSAFLQVGGFDPRFGIGREEGLMALDLATRGWLMLYADELLVHHAPSRNRDADERRSMLLRNGVYLAWLRLPWTAAARETLHAVGEALRSGSAATLVAAIVRSAPWLLRERRVIPAHVERARRLVERSARAVPRALWPLPRPVR